MKNRSLWQILAFYAAASWVVMQVVDVVKDNLGLPDWVFPFALLLLLVGLPIIVATAVLQARGAPAPGPDGDVDAAAGRIAARALDGVRSLSPPAVHLAERPRRRRARLRAPVGGDDRLHGHAEPRHRARRIPGREGDAGGAGGHRRGRLRGGRPVPVQGRYAGLPRRPVPIRTHQGRGARDPRRGPRPHGASRGPGHHARDRSPTRRPRGISGGDRRRSVFDRGWLRAHGPPGRRPQRGDPGLTPRDGGGCERGDPGDRPLVGQDARAHRRLLHGHAGRRPAGQRDHRVPGSAREILAGPGAVPGGA